MQRDCDITAGDRYFQLPMQQQQHVAIADWHTAKCTQSEHCVSAADSLTLADTTVQCTGWCIASISAIRWAYDRIRQKTIADARYRIFSINFVHDINHIMTYAEMTVRGHWRSLAMPPIDRQPPFRWEWLHSNFAAIFGVRKPEFLSY